MFEQMKPKPDYQVLKQVGLSRQSIVCYEQLFKHGHKTAYELATDMCQEWTSLYRTLRKLEQKGFVDSVKSTGRPTYFFAIRLDKALDKHHERNLRITQWIVRDQKYQ